MFRVAVLGWIVAALIALPSCGGPRVYRGERFDPESQYQRLFDAAPAVACQAARSVLLSQGYLISQSGPDAVNGHKEFQPEEETHVDLELTINCDPRGARTIMYANAVQERYQLKKSRQTTSISVPGGAGLSLPLGSSTENLIKTGTETVSEREFYERFFALVGKFLAPGSRPTR